MFGANPVGAWGGGMVMDEIDTCIIDFRTTFKFLFARFSAFTYFSWESPNITTFFFFEFRFFLRDMFDLSSYPSESLTL